MEKVAKNGRKLSLTFWTIFAPFSKIEKVAENGRKDKAIALTFLLFFAHLWKMAKVAKNGRKVKGTMSTTMHCALKQCLAAILMAE